MDWKPVTSLFVQYFFTPLLGLLATMVAGWLFVKMRTAWAEFKQTHAAEAYTIEQIAKMAVKAAEQSNVAGLVTDKRQYAFGVIEKYMATNGFNIDVDVIYAAIEAAVNDAAFPHNGEEVEPAVEPEVFEPPSNLKMGLALPGKKSATSKYEMVQMLAEAYVGMYADVHPTPTPEEVVAFKAKLQTVLENLVRALYQKPRLTDADKWQVTNLINRVWEKKYPK